MDMFSFLEYLVHRTGVRGCSPKCTCNLASPSPPFFGVFGRVTVAFWENSYAIFHLVWNEFDPNKIIFWCSA